LGKSPRLNGTYLIKLLWVAVSLHIRSGDLTWVGEQRVGFGSSLDGPGFDAAGPVADLLLSDQDKEAL